MKSKWMTLVRVLIVIFAFVLMLNTFIFIREVEQDLTYNERCYGLDVLNGYFDDGQYYQIYISTIRNTYSREVPEVDVSQYEAFGRYYNAYMNAMTSQDKTPYLKQMEIEKSKIYWKKIINVINVLEDKLVP